MGLGGPSVRSHARGKERGREGEAAGWTAAVSVVFNLESVARSTMPDGEGALFGARGPRPRRRSHRASRPRQREKERGKEGVGGSPWGHAGELYGTDVDDRRVTTIA